jgi:cytochrome c peroxidase
VVAGCWSDDPQVNGFTPDQWDRLSTSFSLDDVSVDPCRVAGWTFDSTSCGRAEILGQQLFFEPALSGNGQVACVTCHDPTKWFIDSRTPNNVSQSAGGWTKRNAMTLVDIAYKSAIARGAHAFAWDGSFTTPEEVITHLAFPKAMSATPDDIATVLTRDIPYASQYQMLFSDPETPDNIATHVAQVLDVYMRRLVSKDAPFDRWLAGDATALSASAQRGFQVFVGRGACIECHSGPLLSDLEVHVTGVEETGEHVPLTDTGHEGTGAFVTAPLRGIAKTGPYMHDGALRTLADVVEFYRRGGDAEGYAGTKDPRIVPLDLTDDDVRDLVAFLESLTGSDVPAELQMDIRPGAMSCGNTQIDSMNCGSCGHMCSPMQACEGGMCIDANACPLPLAPCGSVCEDLANDPMNCGMCGHTCATYCMGGVCGP